MSVSWGRSFGNNYNAGYEAASAFRLTAYLVWISGTSSVALSSAALIPGDTSQIDTGGVTTFDNDIKF